MDKNFSAEENLAYIRGVMEVARRKTTQAGSFLVVWGSLSAFVTFFHFLTLTGNFPKSYLGILWIFFLVSGVSFTIMRSRKLASENGGPSRNELITSNLFTSTGVSLAVYFLAVAISMIFGFRSNIGMEVCLIISVVMAIAFYGASYSTGIRWLRFVAFGWWGAVILFVMKPYSDEYLMLTIAILDFLLIAVPGLKLMAMVRKGDLQGQASDHI